MGRIWSPNSFFVLEFWQASIKEPIIFRPIINQQTLDPITNEGPYEFRIPPDPHFIQLNKNYIYLQLKVKKPASVEFRIPPINLIGKPFLDK